MTTYDERQHEHVRPEHADERGTERAFVREGPDYPYSQGGPGGLPAAWRDRVRWGPIWAGLVTALATFVLLNAAAVAIGALAVTSGADEETAGLGTAIASAIIALVAFLIGGFVASRTAMVMQRGYGALNGFLVWALGVVLIIALAAFGLGSLFGASGDLFAQYRQMGSPAPEGVDPQAAAEGIRNSSLGALIALLLPAIAAAVGGWLGARVVAETD